MLIQYSIEVPCEPKRCLGYEGVFERLRCLAGVLAADSPTLEETTAGRRAEFQLRPLAFHCVRCPANHPGRAFGCFGMVQCPISQEAEEWLVDLLPLSFHLKKSTGPSERVQVEKTQKLLDRLLELGIRTRGLDDAKRAAGLTEGRQPAERRYGSIFRPSVLHSGQLLHLLLMRDSVDPRDAELVLRALGAWEDGGLGEDGTPEVVFSQPPEEDDDPSVADLKQLMVALLVACSLDVPLRTYLHEEAEVAAPV